MKIKGISISNFRSIGEVPVQILPLRKINVLIGQNNSGKSNLIRALQRIKTIQNNKIVLEEFDYHQRDRKNFLKFAFYIDSDDPHSDFGISGSYSGDFVFIFEVQDNKVVPVDSFLLSLDFADQNRVLTQKRNVSFRSQPSRDQMKVEMNNTANVYLGDILSILPEVHLIPQFRQILPGDKYSLDGKKIIETLGEFQHPELGRDEKRKKFENVQELIKKLIHLPEAKLEVPHSKDSIYIENKGLRLPLESYGTGVHELIILATALYTYDGVIFCIEEPEIHLHPRLQREFLEFIKNETSNTYILSTHSNYFLSLDQDIQIVHLWKQDDTTFGHCAETSLDAVRILEDLGIQPSDILQANFVIWVEGPSDRIYLNRWISIIQPELQEGIDYAIMFYGGKLLSHVSMEREGLTPESFVQLLRLNQRSAIVIDSDRDKSHAKINQTKKRVIDECKKNEVYHWLTDGREIENYLPGHAVAAVYGQLCGVEKELAIGPFDHLEDIVKKAYGKDWRSSYAYENNKPHFARLIGSHITGEDISNNKKLKSNLNKLISIIVSPNVTKEVKKEVGV